MNLFRISVLLILIALIFFACSKETDESVPSHSELTIKQHKENLTKSCKNLSGFLDSVRKTNAVDASVSMFNLIYGNSSDSTLRVIAEKSPVSFVKDFSEFAKKDSGLIAFKYLFGDKTKFENFDFGLFAGKYKWNAISKQWVKSDSSHIIIEYQSNNKALKNITTISFFDNYSQKAINVDGKTVYIPFATRMELWMSGIKELEYRQSAGTGKDGSINFFTESYFINPFTVNYTQSKNIYEHSTIFTILSEDKKLVKISETSAGVFESGFDENKVEKISFYILFEDIRIDFSADIGFLKHFKGELTNEDLKLFIDSKVTYISSNFKIADIVCRKKTDNSIGLFLVFNDNSTDEVQKYTKHIFYEIDIIINKYFGILSI